MEFPRGSATVEDGKLKIAMNLRDMEHRLIGFVREIAMSGFADQRLCAVANTEFEKAFLIMEKAIRLGAPDDYAKHPMPEGGHGFKQRLAGDFDDQGQITAPRKHIEWRDVEDDKPA